MCLDVCIDESMCITVLAKARCYATGYAGLYRRLHRLCLGPSPRTVAEDRRAAMGVPKWYLYIGLFRCLHGSAPPYLAGHFTPVSTIEGGSQLRSAAAGLLLVPRTWTVTILASGRSRFPPLPRGTVSRSIIGIPASVLPDLWRNLKPTYLIQ